MLYGKRYQDFNFLLQNARSICRAPMHWLNSKKQLGCWLYTKPIIHLGFKSIIVAKVNDLLENFFKSLIKIWIKRYPQIQTEGLMWLCHIPSGPLGMEVEERRACVSQLERSGRAGQWSPCRWAPADGLSLLSGPSKRQLLRFTFYLHDKIDLAGKYPLAECFFWCCSIVIVHNHSHTYCGQQNNGPSKISTS